MPGLDNNCWRKSSYSGGNGGNCVEVGYDHDAVLVRDTKDHGHGQVHKFTNDEWRAFVSQVANIDAELRNARQGGQSVAAGPFRRCRQEALSAPFLCKIRRSQPRLSAPTGQQHFGDLEVRTGRCPHAGGSAGTGRGHRV